MSKNSELNRVFTREKSRRQAFNLQGEGVPSLWGATAKATCCAKVVPCVSSMRKDWKSQSRLGGDSVATRGRSVYVHVWLTSHG